MFLYGHSRPSKYVFRRREAFSRFSAFARSKVSLSLQMLLRQAVPFDILDPVPDPDQRRHIFRPDPFRHEGFDRHLVRHHRELGPMAVEFQPLQLVVVGFRVLQIQFPPEFQAVDDLQVKLVREQETEPEAQRAQEMARLAEQAPDGIIKRPLHRCGSMLGYDSRCCNASGRHPRELPFFGPSRPGSWKRSLPHPRFGTGWPIPHPG